MVLVLELFSEFWNFIFLHGVNYLDRCVRNYPDENIEIKNFFELFNETEEKTNLNSKNLSFSTILSWLNEITNKVRYTNIPHGYWRAFNIEMSTDWSLNKCFKISHFWVRKICQRLFGQREPKFDHKDFLVTTFYLCLYIIFSILLHKKGLALSYLAFTLF